MSDKVRTRQDPRLWLVYLGALVSISGIQAITAGLPELKEALGLTDSSLALITSSYLLPGVFLAIPMGLLADRYGRRIVFTTSLVVFGLCGLAMPLAASSFSAIIAVRVIQGIAFSSILPLTITIAGDLVTGPALVQAAGRRSVSIQIGDAVFPILGGLLAAIAWYLPYLLQAVALPVAVLSWRSLKGSAGLARSKKNIDIKAHWENVKDPAIAALMYSGFLRFLIKFVPLTYLAVIVVRTGRSVAFAGLLLGSASAIGAVFAAISKSLMKIALPSRWIAACLIGLAGSMVSFAYWQTGVGLMAGALLFGASDAIYGVILNAYVAGVVRADLRATFVALSGAFRNLGKWLAPTIIGLMILKVELETTFIAAGVLALLSLVTVGPLVKFDSIFRSKEAK